MRYFIAYLSALIFGIGLGISGMTDPSNVKGFLDIFGNWQPPLILVMGGAIAFHGLSYYFITRRQSPLLTEAFLLPSKKDIDLRLVIGSLIFGAGWGLGGFCPGPAIAAAFTLNPSVLVFIGSMSAGIGLYHYAFKPLVLEKVS